MKLLVLSIHLYMFTGYCYAQTWQAVNPPLNLFNGTIKTTAVSESGNIYAAGNFKNSQGNNFVAYWNGSDWQELDKLNAGGFIYTLATYHDTLYVAGGFSIGIAGNTVAKWNGKAWSSLTNNSIYFKYGSIYSLAVDKQGNVYAAGSFTDSSGKGFVAKWDGVAWSKLGSGSNGLNANSNIYSLAIDSDDNVYAAGNFTNASGKRYVAKWNGISWMEVGDGINALNANNDIRCIATDKKGNLYAAGSFNNGSGECYVAKWDGSSWREMGIGSGSLKANGPISTIAIKNEQEIYAAGMFNFWVYYVAKWNGTEWIYPGSNVNFLLNALNFIESVNIDTSGHILAAGRFTNNNGQCYVAQWNGTDWSELGDRGDRLFTPSTYPPVQIVGDRSGSLYVSGEFREPGGRLYLQHWNGKSWKPVMLPDTLVLFIGSSHSMAIDDKGILYITGKRLTGTSFYDCVLKWDGINWTVLEDSPNSLGTINTNPVYGLGEMQMDPQGNLYVVVPDYGSSTSIAKWDGKAWKRLENSYCSGLSTFCVTSTGEIYAYGTFSDEYGRAIIVSYKQGSNSGWSEVKGTNSRLNAPGYNVFSALAIDSHNNLFVNGNFPNNANKRFIMKWDGVNWTETGTTDNLGFNLMIDKNDNIYSTGSPYSFGGRIKKWNGTSWIIIGEPGTIDPLDFIGKAIALDQAGNLYNTAMSSRAGEGIYIIKLPLALPSTPKMSSFTPQRGSLGTIVTINGSKLSGTTAVHFGGNKASSFTVKNDSTLIAVVGYGFTGSVKVLTPAGEDSLKTFTYTCDSVKGPVPSISVLRDSVLQSTTANYYQWYFNNNRIPGAVSNSTAIKNAGFYHVETSTEGICWIPSASYPVLISRISRAEPLQFFLYPNPSMGTFYAYVKLPQLTSTIADIEVFDISGSSVYRTSRLIFYANEIRIPVSINRKGSFIVRMIVNNKTIQQNLVIL